MKESNHYKADKIDENRTKYPNILIEEIQSLFRYGEGFVIPRELGQSRMQ